MVLPLPARVAPGYSRAAVGATIDPGQGCAMVRSRWSGKKLVGAFALVIVFGCGAVAWVERTWLLAWFYVGRLAKSGESDRDRWAENVAGLEEAAVPGLLDLLMESDEEVCRNARAGLEKIGERWGPGSSRASGLATRLARDFPRLSPSGRQNVLELAANWLRPGQGEAPSANLAQPCSRLVAQGASCNDAETRGQALTLCGLLLGLHPEGEAASAGRELARACLADGDAGIRLRAIGLALWPGMDLLEPVAGLLNDPEPEVRRAVLLAVGPADKAVRDEALLPSLHDPDPEVRALCEAALRGRGLGPEHLQLGKSLTDQRPAARLEVLDQLYQVPDLDPALWLRRLTHDPSPGVRVAAVRVISEQNLTQLSDRLDQMARNDPSPTVSQLARYYLQAVRLATRAENEP
jgi:hypothetical protein